MSGSKSKKQRQGKHRSPAHIVSAGYALRSAEAVLAVDLSEVPLSRVTQLVVGWLRAAFEQSRVIATLTTAGMEHAAAPNRRAFWELTIRILWFAGLPKLDRGTAVDTMLNHERLLEKKTDEYMRMNGLPSNIDVGAMEDFFLDVSEDKLMKTEAANLTHAVKGTELNLWMIYRLWREDSTWAHATGFLAGSYAPAKDEDNLGKGKPPRIDRDLDSHRMAAMVIAATVVGLLNDEGVPVELAGEPFRVYMGAK